MRVVSNSSVLIALGGIGRLGVIPANDARCEAPERLRYGLGTRTPFQVHRLRGSPALFMSPRAFASSHPLLDRSIEGRAQVGYHAPGTRIRFSRTRWREAPA